MFIKKKKWQEISRINLSGKIDWMADKTSTVNPNKIYRVEHGAVKSPNPMSDSEKITDHITCVESFVESDIMSKLTNVIHSLVWRICGCYGYNL